MNWKLQVTGLSPLREKQEDLMYSNTMGLLIKSIISFSIINTINKRIKSEREHHQISNHMLFLFSPTATICCWSKTSRRASILTIKDISRYRPLGHQRPLPPLARDGGALGFGLYGLVDKSRLDLRALSWSPLMTWCYTAMAPWLPCNRQHLHLSRK